jgi:hypothetical protein
MAGYSGTPLPQKLGIKPGARVAVFAAPAGFSRTLGTLPEGAKLADGSAKIARFDVGIFFTRSAAELERRVPQLKKRLEPSGGLWIAWPKKASGEKTDMTEDVARRIALANGLVDNKVCAIDETWSGLRIVYRVQDRPAKKAAPRRRA